MNEAALPDCTIQMGVLIRGCCFLAAAASFEAEKCKKSKQPNR